MAFLHAATADTGAKKTSLNFWVIVVAGADMVWFGLVWVAEGMDGWVEGLDGERDDVWGLFLGVNVGIGWISRSRLGMEDEAVVEGEGMWL
jgi:hypothetical protein